jgi:hypothetical protein
MNSFFVHIILNLKFKENMIYMLVLMFMLNTHVIYYFYVYHYNISNNDT